MRVSFALTAEIIILVGLNRHIWIYSRAYINAVLYMTDVVQITVRLNGGLFVTKFRFEVDELGDSCHSMV